MILSFIATLLTSLFGAHVTYWLAHRRRINSIRAASFSSLMFVALAHATGWPLLLALQPAFFGSTYVAMSEPHRLSEKHVLGAALVFGAILFMLQQIDFVHYHGGMGGTLGGTAFLACLAVYALQRAWLVVRR